MNTHTSPCRPGEIDLTGLPPQNREVLERIALLRGLSVPETVAALIREETDRLLRMVSPDQANGKEAA